jgi:TctA family transporter
MEILELLQPGVLVPWALGMLFGIFVGATPGLTATMAVALIVPFSFYLEPKPAAGLSLIIGVSFTAIFAGDLPAVFLRIPGTPASAAGTLDGHQLALQGRGGLAIRLDLLCSALGGLIAVALLILIAPQLARFALQFDSFEYFWLAILGLSISAVVSTGSAFRGALAAVLGMLLATVGIDVVSGVPRFTFGSADLMGGMGFVPPMIGLFGLSEVLRSVLHPGPLAAPSSRGEDRSSMLQALGLMWRHRSTVLSSSLTGTVVGALPGAGADIAAWAAYGIAQRTSREPEKFGTGAIQGVIAPTSANNAAVGGAWIPALVFGIPGDTVTAIALGALLMYDIKPGPLIFERSRDAVHAIFTIGILTQLLLIPVGYLGIKGFAWILRLPRSIVLTAVVFFSVVGSFALRNSIFDVWVMIAFGLLGFYLESRRVPLAPLILGLILGPMVEEHLRAGLIQSRGEITPFLVRPISAALAALLLAAFLARPAVRLLRLAASVSKR